MASAHGETPVIEEDNPLEYSFSELQSYARTRGEVVRLIKAAQIMPPPIRRYTCQVVMGERHFSIMSADSRQEAREQAIKATMVLLLGEDEMQMREEERQSAQPSSSSSSSLQTLIRTEVKERLSPQPSSSSSSSLQTLVKTEVKEMRSPQTWARKRKWPSSSSSSSSSLQTLVKTEVKEERLSPQTEMKEEDKKINPLTFN